MRDHHALGQGGAAAGELQKSQVVAAQRLGSSQRAEGASSVSCSTVTSPLREGTLPTADQMTCSTFLFVTTRVGSALRMMLTSVETYVSSLPKRQRRVQRNRNDAGPEGSKERRNKVRAVGEDHRQPVPLLEAQATQVVRPLDGFRPQPVPTVKVFLSVKSDEGVAHVEDAAARIQGLDNRLGIPLPRRTVHRTGRNRRRSFDLARLSYTSGCEGVKVPRRFAISRISHQVWPAYAVMR